MNRRLLSLSVWVTLILGGCSLAPKYTQPSAPIQNEWPQGEAYQTPQSAPIVSELGREKFFADVQLQQILELALENNRDLRLAALNVERARALYGIQRAELFPSVNASASGSKQRTSVDLTTPGYPRTTTQYGINLGITSWEIDFFGRLRNLKDQALETYLASDEARRGALIALMGEVAKVYLTLAADEENRELSRFALETQQAAYDLIKKSYEAGIVTELDLRQAEIPLETARGDVVRYTQLVAQDKNALNLLVGTDIPQELLPADLGSITPPRDISPGLPSEILLQRPDILAAEHQLKGAYASIGAARAAFFPNISLTSLLGNASDELAGLFGSGTDTWTFASQVSMPIFDARTWAAYRVSKTDREIALTNYEKTIQTAFREVADTLAVQGTIDQRIEAQQALVTAVAETYRLSEIRYTQGLDSYLGVLNAQLSQLTAKQGLITLRLAKFANQVQLYTVLGGGSFK